MPDPGSVEVGKAHIEITADNSSVDSKVTETQAKTKDLGNTAQQAGDRVDAGMDKAEKAIDEVGNAAQDAGAKVQASMDNAAEATERVEKQAKQTEAKYTGFFKRAGQSATKFQSIVSKIAIPVAVLGSIASIARLFGQAAAEAQRLREETERIADQSAKTLQQEVIAARTTDELERRRIQLLNERLEKQLGLSETTAKELEKENKLFGLQSEIIGVSVNNLLRAVGFRRSLAELNEQDAKAVKSINEDYRERLALIDAEIAKRRQAEAEQTAAAARAFERTTKLLEAQAEGQRTLIEEQMRQLAEEYAEQINKADDEAQKNSLRRRFAAQRRLFVQQIQNIEEAERAQIEADENAAKERERRAAEEQKKAEEAAAKREAQEREAHQRRLRDIEERARKEREALEDLLRRQQEGFDRINQELVVGLKGIATAVQQARSRSSAGPIELGGGA